MFIVHTTHHDTKNVFINVTTLITVNICIMKYDKYDIMKFMDSNRKTLGVMCHYLGNL